MSVMEIWLQASKGINVGDPLIHAYWKLWLKCYCACLEVAVHTLCQSDYSQKVKAKDFCFCRWSADFFKNLKTKHCSESLRKQIRELTKLKLKSLRHCFLYGLCRLVLTLILYYIFIHLEKKKNNKIKFSSGDSSKFFLHFLLREAARECRRKKKEYVKCLENRVAVLENQNKTLIEELKALKDIYCHKAE